MIARSFYKKEKDGLTKNVGMSTIRNVLKRI